MSKRLSKRDAVARLFLAFPGQWLSDQEFYGPGGRDAWRTRISDCRSQLGMNIENRLTRYPWGTLSEYRYIKPAAPVQGELFPGRAA